MAATDEQLVRTITERVMAQVQAKINGMQEKIEILEAKVETESNKRMQLEQELRKLKEGPPQRMFLRNYTHSQGEKNPEVNGDTAADKVHHTRATRTQSEVGARPLSGLHSQMNGERKSEWVKAPLPAEAVKGGDAALFDTVLFDTASDRTIREGMLEKMGKTRQTWKVRFFRLQQGSLFYYKTSKDKKPIGEIALQNCSIFRSNAKKPYRNEFTISLPSRDWLLCAQSDEDTRQWVEAVTSCSTKATIYYQ